MTDTNDQQADPSAPDEDEYWAQRNAALPDAALGAIVYTVTKSGGEIPVTLTVGGSLITGTLVSRVDWLSALAAEYGKTVLDSFIGPWEEVVQEIKDTSGSDTRAYESFAHLKDARWFGSGLPDGGGPSWFWRGRLSEVQGWSIGVLGASAPNEAD